MKNPTVFVSYSRKDKAWKDRLVTQLSTLERQGRLSVWHDDRIGSGQDWLMAIRSAMASAKAAILLVSPDYLSSEFIQREEFPHLLEFQQQKGMVVIPVIVRDCAWQDEAKLASMQVRLFKGKAIAAHRGNDRDTALAEIAREALNLLKEEAEHSGTDLYLDAYRRGMSSLFPDWNLGSTGLTHAGGTIKARLDEMYVPLRFGEGFDPHRLNLGRAIMPEDLLAREHPLVIRGFGGQGKTTWMRWTFRRLLEPSLGAFPVMLVARDLTRRWQSPGCEGRMRALDSFLESRISEYLVGNWEGEFLDHLTKSTGVRPVLLVDGWDEAGPLGGELRDKLEALRKESPRLLVVVTTRPHGDNHPAYGEGFEVLDIQPLSDQEVGVVAERYLSRYHRQDPAAVRRERKRFRLALEASPEARELARTVLYLVMMLLISRRPSGW